jgi:adenylate cyclase 10
VNNACSIGIATGTIYVGVIGATGSRREYSVLGDAVNTALRFMLLAAPSKILIDFETAKEASFKMDFKEFKKLPIKGKTDEVFVYEPEEITPRIRTSNPFFP